MLFLLSAYNFQQTNAVRDGQVGIGEKIVSMHRTIERFPRPIEFDTAVHSEYHQRLYEKFSLRTWG